MSSFATSSSAKTPSLVTRIFLQLLEIHRTPPESFTTESTRTSCKLNSFQSKVTGISDMVPPQP